MLEPEYTAYVYFTIQISVLWFLRGEFPPRPVEFNRWRSSEAAPPPTGWTAPYRRDRPLQAVFIHQDLQDLQDLPGGGRALPGGGRDLPGGGRALPGGCRDLPGGGRALPGGEGSVRQVSDVTHPERLRGAPSKTRTVFG